MENTTCPSCRQTFPLAEQSSPQVQCPHCGATIAKSTGDAPPPLPTARIPDAPPPLPKSQNFNQAANIAPAQGVGKRLLRGVVIGVACSFCLLFLTIVMLSYPSSSTPPATDNSGTTNSDARQNVAQVLAGQQSAAPADNANSKPGILKRSAPNTDIEVDAESFDSEFGQNRFAFDKKYTGKLIGLRGKVGKVLDEKPAPVVCLEGAINGLMQTRLTPCQLQGSEASLGEQLESGDLVRIVGRYNTAAETLLGGDRAQLDDCVIAEMPSKGTATKKTTETGTLASPMTLKQLVKDIDENEARAMKKYKGQRMVLKAKWDNVDETLDGLPILNVTDYSIMAMANCTLRRDQRDAVANADMKSELLISAVFEGGSRNTFLVFVDGVLNPTGREAGSLSGDTSQAQAQPQTESVKPMVQSNQGGRSALETAEELRNFGKKYFDAGQWENAINIYNQALQVRPNYVDVQFWLAASYSKLGRQKDAVDAYRSACTADSDYVRENLPNVPELAALVQSMPPASPEKPSNPQTSPTSATSAKSDPISGQTESQGASKWIPGEWTRAGSSTVDSGLLTIHSISTQGFSFTLNVTSGDHVGFIEGTAVVNSVEAVYLDKDSSCQVTFVKGKQGITISTSTECSSMGGSGISFDGEFLPGKIKLETTSLASVGILESQAQENTLKEIAAEYFHLFPDTLQVFETKDSNDSFTAKVVSGSLRGAFGYKGAIIMVRPDGMMYAAVVDDEVIRYFTNDPNFMAKLPKTIDKWRESFPSNRVVNLGGNTLPVGSENAASQNTSNNPPQMATVKAQGVLNVRENPSMNANIVAKLQTGTMVTVIESPPAEAPWVRIQESTNNIKGWVHGEYLEYGEGVASSSGVGKWRTGTWVLGLGEPDNIDLKIFSVNGESFDFSITGYSGGDGYVRSGTAKIGPSTAVFVQAEDKCQVTFTPKGDVISVTTNRACWNTNDDWCPICGDLQKQP